MKLSELIKTSGRSFLSPTEIREIVTARDDSGRAPHLLLLLDTTRQRTWLAATDRYLYCVFDILTKPAPTIHWRLSKRNLLKDGKPDVQVLLTSSADDQSNGLVRIGDKNERKFSKRLFEVVSVKEQIERLLKQPPGPSI